VPAVPSHAPRRLTLALPPLTPAQADAIFQLLADLQDAFWCAYEDTLLDVALDRTAAAQEEQLEAEMRDDPLWVMPADRT
jgi:hypothetical protein